MEVNAQKTYWGKYMEVDIKNWTHGDIDTKKWIYRNRHMEVDT